MRMLDGWSATKVRAARFAAAIRVGARSLAFMLADTSNARTTVPSRRGRSMFAWGRAMPTSRTTTPRRKTSGTTCRRQPSGRPVRVAGRAMVPSSLLVGGAPLRDPEVADNEHRDEEQEQQRARLLEGHRWPRCFRMATMRTMTRTMSSSVDTS